MANLIRLKQIESGSFLNTAATIGQDFSQSVVDIIVGEVTAVLPDGVISSSAQIVLGDTTGQLSGSRVIGDIAATSINYEDIIGLPTLVSGSAQIIDILIPLNQHSASINEFTTSVNTQISASLANTLNISSSVNTRLTNLESFSSSLDNGFATDAELSLTSSLIVDQGEW